MNLKTKIMLFKNCEGEIPLYLCLCHTKGQLISKCLFGVLNSSKKQTKTSRQVVKLNLFVRFLEELKTPKRHFEIN